MFKYRSLNYATAKRAKIRKMHVFENLVLNEKIYLTSYVSKTARITESWLDQGTSDEGLKLNGYKLFRRDRVGDNHGGICVYVRENTLVGGMISN